MSKHNDTRLGRQHREGASAFTENTIRATISSWSQMHHRYNWADRRYHSWWYRKMTTEFDWTILSDYYWSVISRNKIFKHRPETIQRSILLSRLNHLSPISEREAKTHPVTRNIKALAIGRAEDHKQLLHDKYQSYFNFINCVDSHVL